MRGGAAAYLFKPFSPDQVLAKCLDILGLKRSQRHIRDFWHILSIYDSVNGANVGRASAAIANEMSSVARGQV